MLWDEARIAKKRINSIAATNALLTQLAVGALFDKEAGKRFNRTIERLTDGDS